MLSSLLSPRLDALFALLRGSAGLMFAFHGTQKLFGVLAERVPPIGSQLWFGGIIELVTGLAITVGLMTRPAAFLASGTMAVAYVQFHWQLALGPRFFPTINQGELALLYSLLFLYFAAHGGGRFSLDARRGALD
ncbi:MAG TPA: DoxX family protein [Polyangiaceae bacterium]|nr:DoxX family protein [Polyangiaceae bacterium]